MMIPDYVGMFLTFIMHDRIEEYEQDLAIVKEDYAGLEQNYLNTLEYYGKLLLERAVLADKLATATIELDKQKEYNQNLSDQLTLVTAQRDNSVDTIMKLTGDNIELGDKLRIASQRKEKLRQAFVRVTEIASTVLGYTGEQES